MEPNQSSIDWNSKSNFYFLNPRLTSSQKVRLSEKIEKYFANNFEQGLIALQTSGTTGDGKTVILDKNAFLAAAKSVNDRLQVAEQDRWLRALPLFHVGGLSIEARAHLSNAKVISTSTDWDAKIFHQTLQSENIQWASIVPTQLFDIVNLGLKPTVGIKALVLGGGFTSTALAEKAQALGWPLWWSYGMTETAAMISLGKKPWLDFLPHVETRITNDDFLEIKSKALFRGYLDDSGTLRDEKTEGWWRTSDKVIEQEKHLILVGRGQDYIKVSGEGIYLQELQDQLDTAMAQTGEAKATIWPAKDARRGSKITVVFEGQLQSNAIQKILKAYNMHVLPVFRVQEWTQVPSFPRNAMGKINRIELEKILTKNFNILGD